MAIDLLTNSSIELEAASWISQLDSDNMTDADRLALREWASRSPKHLYELQSLGGMWHHIDSLLQDEIESIEVEHSMTQVLITSARLKPKTVIVTFTLACATLLTLLIGMPYTNSVHKLNEPRFERVYRVPEGSNQQVLLSDSSVVHINTDSLVEVEYNDKQRVIRLTRGEAHFEVAHDPQRPFYVYAGGNVVRAIGTAFSVRVNADETSILVTAGKVKFTPLESSQPPFNRNTNAASIKFKPALLSAGQTLSVANNTSVSKVINISQQKLDKELAWRDGLIIFDGESLEEVVKEISRYTPKKIIISDSRVRNLPIGGVFEVGRVDALLGALRDSFGVKVERINDNLIYLTKLEPDN